MRNIRGGEIPPLIHKRGVSVMAKSKWESVKGKLAQVEMWARSGLTEKQIAKNLGISVATLEVYKNERPEFIETLKKGKDVADFEVENALYQKALGYDVEEQKAVKVTNTYYDENGKKCQKEEVVVVPVMRHIPADTTAQIFWLKNRRRQQWRDNPHKVEIDKELLKLKKEEAENKW